LSNYLRYTRVKGNALLNRALQDMKISYIKAVAVSSNFFRQREVDRRCRQKSNLATYVNAVFDHLADCVVRIPVLT
jgi:hypothetical protein